MIIFFYGEDSFRLKQAVKKLKEKFISASLGDTNLAVLDGKEVSYEEVSRQILAIPFLSKTRLVIIENLISDGKKEIQEKVVEILKKVPSTTVLLFTEAKPDKRTALYKKLVKVDKIQEFLPLEEQKLAMWIRKEVEDRGGNIEPEASRKLIEYVGNDLWRLSNEIQKLVTYNPQLTIESINLLVKPQIESDIFKLIDALGTKNLKSAYKEFQSLQEEGKNELYILSMIVYQYRNLLIVKDLVSRENISNSWTIAKKAGLNPYVAQKTLNQSKHFSLSDLRTNYRTLLNFDVGIKTGKIESRVALTLLLASLCN